ncbi:MAG TPA: ATPase, T2SS/T4P/T4SS family [Candidatus Binatia bacterium]
MMKKGSPREPRQQPKLGELLVQESLVTREQLEEALAAQKKQQVYMPLGEVCIDLKFITRDQLRKIISAHKKRIPIGELLANLGLVTPQQVEESLQEQKAAGKKLGEVLIEKGFLTEKALISALNMQLGVPKITPHPSLIDKSLLKGVNENFLRKNQALPAFKQGKELTVLMADPLNEAAIRDLEKFFACTIQPAIASAEEIQNAITQCFRINPATGMAEEKVEKDLVIGQTDLSAQTGDTTIGIVNYIISDAFKERASDIHIEAQEKGLRVRNRVDGVLYHKTDLPQFLAPAVISRIKVLCGLDIAEKRRHQDGRIEARVMGQEIDLRVSTYAGVYGESIVIRVLQRQTSLIDLDALGFSPANRAKYAALLEHPSGIMLVTGPTGSGKTTTLYASLSYLNSMFRKIITVEDPVEYTLDGIVQGHLDPKLGLSYVDFLKSMMRQDPDVLMVGEIRERASAEAVIQAALTGHKVLTTFHTDDTAGALLRMIDIGIEPYLISSTVAAVLTQRLVRVLCPNCRQPFVPREEILAAFLVDPGALESLTFYQPKGCMHCNGTGFKGRIGLHELLIINDPIREAISSRSTSTQIRLVAREHARLISMREDGLYKATQGLTTLEEIMRVVFHHESDAMTPRGVAEVIALCEGKDGGDARAPWTAQESAPETRKRVALDTAPGVFTSGDASAPVLEGEAYRVRFDANTVESETERIADFFEAYRKIKENLGETIDPETMGDFADFIVDTVNRLRTSEGAAFAEFSLHVRDNKDRIFVETLMPPRQPPGGPASLETGLRQVGFLK